MQVKGDAAAGILQHLGLEELREVTGHTVQHGQEVVHGLERQHCGVQYHPLRAPLRPVPGGGSEL